MPANGRNTAGVLSSRDRQIAALVASGLTYTEAGEQLKLCERTVRRALARPEVRAEVDAIRSRTIETGLGALCDGFGHAVKELARLVKEGTAADAIKLGAVRLTIEAVLKVREHTTLARRLEELERAADGAGGPTEGAGEGDSEAPHGPAGAGGARA